MASNLPPRHPIITHIPGQVQNQPGLKKAEVESDPLESLLEHKLHSPSPIPTHWVWEEGADKERVCFSFSPLLSHSCLPSHPSLPLSLLFLIFPFCSSLPAPVFQFFPSCMLYITVLYCHSAVDTGTHYHILLCFANHYTTSLYLKPLPFPVSNNHYSKLSF